ncbi:hypothetical protein CL622_06645 [archaeon]|nr:hypothetical protein [archaeon]|tara:strand:+ start:207 stop:821 length:615 start_codon:yes stop_codon:yes gene_type:complete
MTEDQVQVPSNKFIDFLNRNIQLGWLPNDLVLKRFGKGTMPNILEEELVFYRHPCLDFSYATMDWLSGEGCFYELVIQELVDPKDATISLPHFLIEFYTDIESQVDKHYINFPNGNQVDIGYGKFTHANDRLIEVTQHRIQGPIDLGLTVFQNDRIVSCLKQFLGYDKLYQTMLENVTFNNTYKEYLKYVADLERKDFHLISAH